MPMEANSGTCAGVVSTGGALSSVGMDSSTGSVAAGSLSVGSSSPADSPLGSVSVSGSSVGLGITAESSVAGAKV